MVLVMQSEKRGVEIDPTLRLLGLSELYEIAYSMHACMLLGLLAIISLSVYNVLQSYRNSFARARAGYNLIFAFQWLHSAYRVTQCVPMYEYSHVLVSDHSQHIRFPSIKGRRGAHGSTQVICTNCTTVHMYCT